LRYDDSDTLGWVANVGDLELVAQGHDRVAVCNEDGTGWWCV